MLMSQLPVDLVRTLKRQFDLTAFVETGCYLGDGIAAALEAGFRDIRSCDIDPARIEQCQLRFSGQEALTLRLGASSEVLPDLLPDADVPTLFWLDAHYPGHYGLNHMETRLTKFPVQFELAKICTLHHGASRDVILIDDMRVIASDDNPLWREGEVDDYYRVDDLTIKALVEPFEGTHQYDIDLQQEGILILTPKHHAQL